MSRELMLLAALALGYLLGSIPFGLILTRLAGGGDIRAIGSGNIGATNVLRTGRKGLAAATLVGDLLKGTVAVIIAGFTAGPEAAMAAALGAFDGSLTTIRAHETGPDGRPNPTYRCLFPSPPPPGSVAPCAEAGVLGALAGVMGSLMAMEVIRALAGFGEPLVGRLLMVDARSMRFETLHYAWDPDNPLNGDGVRTGPAVEPAGHPPQPR